MTEEKRGGVFVAVVGPSGAGKDAIIDYARQRLQSRSGLHFARRVVTRTSVEGAEDHDSMSDEAFVQAIEQGKFCFHWKAHGLYYGLPVSLDDLIGNGDVVIANLSRMVLPELHRVYRNVVEVHVMASSAVLAERLASRGRESRESIGRRLERAAACDPPGAHAVVLDNSGRLEVAGDRFVAILEKARCRNP
ncbi:MAG: phosphonate metabolism protein/1,5-bisphosphokinase (PRPP-forming) PhnN [Phyllobacterium sp.]